MNHEQRERLNSIGWLLEGAGHDNGFITLNAGDTELLGLLDNKDMIEIEVLPDTLRTVQPRDDDPALKPRTAKVRAVEPVRNTDHEDEDIKSYKVNNKLARKAFKEKNGGRPPRDMRQPDPVMKPEPVEV